MLSGVCYLGCVIWVVLSGVCLFRFSSNVRKNTFDLFVVSELHVNIYVEVVL